MESGRRRGGGRAEEDKSHSLHSTHLQPALVTSLSLALSLSLSLSTSLSSSLYLFPSRLPLSTALSDNRLSLTSPYSVSPTLNFLYLLLIFNTRVFFQSKKAGSNVSRNETVAA